MMRALLALVSLLSIAACSEPLAPQRPDLSFWFRCEQRADPELERRIEAFLHQQGFRVLNLGALQRRAKVAIHDLSITAIDARRRTVIVYAFESTPGSQSVALYSPPPTQHDAVLEDSLLTFATQGLGCKTDQVTRSSNGPEAAAMHESEVRRIEGLFEQAAELSRGAGIP